MNRSIFDVDISRLSPVSDERQSRAAGLGSGHRTSVLASVPDLHAAHQVSPSQAGVPGTIINHSPADSGCYIGSPSLAILPNGDYVASHDFFGPKANHTKAATTFIFVSRDRGQSWQQAAKLIPCFWGKLFVHKGELYLLGTSHEYGDVLIRRSEDGGRTWTVPSGPTTGLLRVGRYHCAPCPILVHSGRIWRSMEAFTGGEWGNFSAMVLSATTGADLLAASSWTFSQALPKQEDFCWLEGNIVLGPGGKIINILRTNDAGHDKAALVGVSDDGQQLSFDGDLDIIDMPGGGSKFTIRYDAQTVRYWSIVNKQTDPAAFRSNLVLVSSKDLRKWRVESPLLYHVDSEKHAWQYVDWQFAGNDMVYASRTAFDDGLGGAQNAHDANYLTFHKVRDFRLLAGADRLPSGHKPVQPN